MIFSTKTMHASTRKQTICRPYCHSEIVMISFFYNISIIVRWISNWYDSFNKNKFIIQTSAIWAHTTCLSLCCVHFLSPLVISAHALVQNKVNWGPRHWSLRTFSKKLWSFTITAIYSFLPINENAFYKTTTHYPKFVNKILHHWPVNLRAARKFTGLPPKEAIDLRVVRKSTTSPLPDECHLYSFHGQPFDASVGGLAELRS